MPPRKRAVPPTQQGETDLDKALAGIIPVETEDGVMIGFHPAFPVELIQPFHKNPRRGDVKLIQGSLKENGQYRTIVLNVGTHTGRPVECLAGNHTWLAAKAEGRATMPVNFVDVDEQRAIKIVAVDNAANDKSKTDKAVLADLLGDLDSLDGSGITDEEFAKMLGGDDPDTSPMLPDQGYALIIDCDDEVQQAELLSQLEDEGLRVRPLMM